MDFIKRFFINLLALGAVFLVMYLIFPEMMKLVYQAMGALFGPAILVLLVVAACLPGRKRRRRY